VGDKVYFYNKYSNEISTAEIVSMRESHLNWDYNLRYHLYVDLLYYCWVEEQYINRNEKALYKFLK
jgi:hypothetical protein